MPSDNNESYIKNQQDISISDKLKRDYKINKNISDKLSVSQRQEILELLQNNSAVSNLVDTLISKNSQLSVNNRQIGKKYTKEIKKQSAEIEAYQHKLEELIREKQREIEKFNQAKRELEKINTEVKVAVARVKHEKSVMGKFSRMLDFLRILFVDENEIRELMKVDNSYPGKPQMNTDSASIQRDLLDR